NVSWPQLLHPIDDLPPATVITQVRREKDKLLVRGVSHDNGEIVAVTGNGQTAQLVESKAGVVDWTIELPAKQAKLPAGASDRAGNAEQTPHVLDVSGEAAR